MAANPVQTPEAVDIAKTNPLMRNIAHPPQTFTDAGGASVEIYNEFSEPRCEFIEIQNRSNAVVFVSYNSDCSPNLNHVVLAAGAAANDGLGGVVSPEVRKRGIKRICVYSASALNLNVQKYQYNQTGGFL